MTAYRALIRPTKTTSGQPMTASLYVNILLMMLGLIAGSLMNVIIHRYPGMICRTTPPSDAASTPETYNLATPRSHCPHCRHTLHAKHLIPVVSFLCLKGRCAFCHHPIAWRYFGIELGAAGLCLLAFHTFNQPIEFVCATLLSWLLLMLATIDIEHFLLPDDLTLGGLWLGLLANGILGLGRTALPQAILGAVIGYLSCWLIAQLYRWLRKKDGLGLGDAKMLAMLGAWFGVLALPSILLVAAIAGLTTTLLLICFKRTTAASHIPLGGYLALAGGLFLYVGPTLQSWLLGS